MKEIKLRALERKDLYYVHQLDNMRDVMALWFKEPYESVDELESLYEKHIHDDSERRFVIDVLGEFAGIIELVSIDFIHRFLEIQIIIKQKFKGQGLAQKALNQGLNYAFNTLNMHKVYLYVDEKNDIAIHIYKKYGFIEEGMLRKHFFVNGSYHNSIFMGILKEDFKLIGKLQV